MVLRAAFPRDTEVARFAERFSTRDYFRWQLELGQMEGIGAVRSEPSSVLGGDSPLVGILPPDLMISFVVTGDVGSVVSRVVRDLERRLSGGIQPTELVVRICSTLENSTPAQVAAEVDRWSSRGYQLEDSPPGAFTGPMERVTLLFDFPRAGWPATGS